MSDIARKIRILCVDDHEFIRDGISHLLRKQPDMELIAEANDGREAVEAYRKHRPDVVLMDLRMPHMNGIEAVGAIREFHPQAKVIMLTTYAGDVNAAQSLKAGAAGYLLKSTLRNGLIDAIRAVASGKRHVPAEIASSIAEFISSESLSAREVEVLRSVAEGLSNKAVAADLHITEDTVKGHMRGILSKLGANDRTHAVLIALKRGILGA